MPKRQIRKNNKHHHIQQQQPAGQGGRGVVEQIKEVKTTQTIVLVELEKGREEYYL